MLLLLSFASLDRFAPNLRDQGWEWSTPGAVVATSLWAGSALLLRTYLHFSSFQTVYGGLGAVVTLLLWLYLTSAAIFIGGPAQFALPKGHAEAARPDARGPAARRGGGTGPKSAAHQDSC